MHIIFLNPQGNFDDNDSHWTTHKDFGGQLVYVKELAIQMAKKGHKIDIVTRIFEDEKFNQFSKEIDYYSGVSNLRIVRIKCGGNKFLEKEKLWDYLDEWTNNIISFYQKEKSEISFVTGHYGDGGLAAAMLKEKINTPYSFTGHSLGAQKLDKLYFTEKDLTKLDKKYNFSKRIIAENIAIRNSDIVFVSTTQEKEEQYQHKLYINSNFIVTNTPNFKVAPPGANTTVFDPLVSNETEELTNNRIDKNIERDIDETRKELPFIISASRLDAKKNHVGLVKAYALSKELKQRANLVISLRGIDNPYKDYANALEDEKIIIENILNIINEYNLQGKVMFVSINSQNELASFYRILASKKSIFTLSALYEPFGLAPIEAMYAGLPVAVTKNGGPSEVLEENGEKFGVLFDPVDYNDIAKKIIYLFDNYDHYKTVGFNRVKSKYTWSATADIYLKEITKICQQNNNYSKQIIPNLFRSSKLEKESLSLEKIYLKELR